MLYLDSFIGMVIYRLKHQSFNPLNLSIISRFCTRTSLKPQISFVIINYGGQAVRMQSISKVSHGPAASDL